MGIESFYAGFMAFSYAFVYVGVFFLYRFLFRYDARLGTRACVSVAAVTSAFIAFYALSYLIPDAAVQNRFLHATAGGFLAMVACFLAVHDTMMPMGRARFFVMSALVVTMLGVLNELAELALYFVTDTPPYVGRLDTWFDLASNTVGLLAAAAVVLPFVEKEKDL